MFEKKEKSKGQTSVELLIVLGGILIIAIVVVMIFISTGSAKADDITATDTQHQKLLDNTIFPPTLDAIKLTDSSDENITIEVDVIESASSNVKDYCLVVNDEVTDYCGIPTASGKIIYNIPKATTNYYAIALVSRSNQDKISTNSFVLTGNIATVGTDTGEIPGGELNFDCPEGYTKVPGDTNYSTTYNKGGFCVMTYEAKVDVTGDGNGDTTYNSQDCKYTSSGYTIYVWDLTTSCNLNTLVPKQDYNIVSSQIGYPIGSISSLSTAKNFCETGVNYNSSLYESPHLITNEERMTISRNLEKVKTNWQHNNVESGNFKTGNKYQTVIPNTSYNFIYAIPGVSTLGFIDSGSTNTLSNSNRTSASPARLFLNNGEEIWDFVGNVSEWVDKTIYCSLLPRGNDGAEYLEFNNITQHTGLQPDEYKPLGNLNSVNGGGLAYFNWDGGNSTCYFLHGMYRSWMDNVTSAYIGLYNIYVSDTISGSASRIQGFRCVLVPK